MDKESVLIVDDNDSVTKLQNSGLSGQHSDKLVIVGGRPYQSRLNLARMTGLAAGLSVMATAPRSYDDVDLFKAQGPVFDPDRLHRSLHGTQTVSGKPRKDRTKAKLAKKARQKQRKSK